MVFTLGNSDTLFIYYFFWFYFSFYILCVVFVNKLKVYFFHHWDFIVVMTVERWKLPIRLSTLLVYILGLFVVICRHSNLNTQQQLQCSQFAFWFFLFIKFFSFYSRTTKVILREFIVEQIIIYLFIESKRKTHI